MKPNLIFKIFLKKDQKRFIWQNFSKNLDGFTLLEFLVVTAIIGILTSIAFVNYHNTNQELALQRAVYKLAQDIRRTGELAMAAKECCGGIVPPSYGVYLESGNPNYCVGNRPICYILYADRNGNESYQPSDDKIETIELEKGIIIYDIDTANKKADINFKPPSPTIQINGGTNDVTITLTIDGTGGTGPKKKVKVNAAGLAEVE